MWLYGRKSSINVEGDLFLKRLIKEFMLCYYFPQWATLRNNAIMLILWSRAHRILNMATNTAATVRCLRISHLCRPLIADGIRCILRKSCVLFYHRCGLSYLVLGRSGSPAFARHSVGSFFTLRENRLSTTGPGPDNTPQLSKWKRKSLLDSQNFCVIKCIPLSFITTYPLSTPSAPAHHPPPPAPFILGDREACGPMGK